MATTFFGWLAVCSFVAVLFTHPIRDKAFGPRLITFLLFLCLASFGFYVVLNLLDFYMRGLAPILSRGGGVLVISAQPLKAYFFITLHLLLGAASIWAGVWFLRIAIMRRNTGSKNGSSSVQ